MRKRREKHPPKLKKRRPVLPKKPKPPIPPMQTPPSLGSFAQSGVQFSNPGTGPLGPVEHMKGVKEAGYAYVSFEVFQGSYPAYSSPNWMIWRRQAEAQGLPYRPWAHCRIPEDVVMLCSYAQAWGQPPIVNIEVEANTTLPPWKAAELIKTHWGGEFCVQTLAILYDDVDWRPLNDLGAVCALEAYTNEIPAYADWPYLLKRAASDFYRVILSPGHYPWPPGSGQYPDRALYAGYPAPWLLWIGDNVHDWSAWGAP